MFLRPPVNIDQLMKEWSEDSAVDSTSIEKEILKISSLHGKYLNIMSHHRHVIRKLESDYKMMKGLREDYLQGHLSKEDLDKAKNTADPLTNTVNTIEKNAQSMKVALEQELTPAINVFARELLNAGESISNMLERLGIKKSTAAAAPTSPMQNESGMNFNHFDVGGIASGPSTGYNARLHGTEAVVPLPDNRSIPVSLDSSSLTTAINNQTGILNQILSSMNKNNSLTSGILQASM